jgi:GNAT superfamily N-acetyltransferase
MGAMTALTVRPMTPDEYAQWQTTIATEYAAEQVAAGRWAEDGAVQRALDENAELLPDGLQTPRTLLLTAVDAAGAPVGRAWVSLDHPRGAPDVAFLYDIEVAEPHRGKGYGRALLAAVEQATRETGVGALELNVFGHNATAISLYGSSGYDVVTQQMRKAL